MVFYVFACDCQTQGHTSLQNNSQQQSYIVNIGQKTISTSREEIRRLKAQFETKDEQNRNLTDNIQGLQAAISNSNKVSQVANSRINYLTNDLEKQKRTVGKYWIQLDTLKNELQAGSFGNAS